jgi:hypothetical protein
MDTLITTLRHSSESVLESGDKYASSTSLKFNVQKVIDNCWDWFSTRQVFLRILSAILL